VVVVSERDSRQSPLDILDTGLAWQSSASVFYRLSDVLHRYGVVPISSWYPEISHSHQQVPPRALRNLTQNPGSGTIATPPPIYFFSGTKLRSSPQAINKAVPEVTIDCLNF